MRVIGYDDTYFEHEFKASLCYMNSHLKEEGRKVKGHKDQWGQKHLLHKYEYLSLIPRPTQKLTCSMNIWTPTVSEADRRLLAAHGPAIQPCLCSREAETLPQIRWTVTTDIWGRPVISICTLTQAYPRSHMRMVTFVHVCTFVCMHTRHSWSNECYLFE